MSRADSLHARRAPALSRGPAPHADAPVPARATERSAPRILLLSDDTGYARALIAAGRAERWATRVEPIEGRAVAALRDWRPSVVLFDIDADSLLNGLVALGEKARGPGETAVVAIARREQLALVARSPRADDFILAPIDEEELRVRLVRLLVPHTVTEEAPILRLGALVIDTERYTVSVDGEAVDLTYKEYELLRFLASNPGKPFTREALMNRVWGYDYYGGSRTVDVHIRRIRAKIERHEPYIETMRNIGYRFVETARREPARRRSGT